MMLRMSQRGDDLPGATCGRRAFARGLAGLVAASVVAPRTGLAEPPEPAAPAAPTRVLLVGDSMIAGAFGLFLARELEATYGCEVIREGKSSTGLSRPDFFDWIEKGASLARRHAPYDAAACMFGGNDGQGLFMGRRANPKWIRYGEPGWDDEYRRRVVAFADAITPADGSLHWIGMPVMAPTRLHERVRHLNKIYRGEMCIRPRCQFVDIWRSLSNDAGAYSRRLVVDGKRVSVRASDGVHLTVAGAHYLVSDVAPRLAKRLPRREPSSRPG